jgi:probable RNA-binding protein EIF1AD
MPKPKQPKRNLHAIDQETTTPPDALSATQQIARVHSAAGNNLYRVDLAPPPPSSSSSTSITTEPTSSSSTTTTILVELPLRFRHTIWIKRGMYVVIDTEALAARENKLGGEIVNIVREEKEWRKMSYWPKEFPVGRSWATTTATGEEDSSEEEEDRGPRMPSDSEDEED